MMSTLSKTQAQLGSSFRKKTTYSAARGESNVAKEEWKECMSPADPHCPDDYKHSTYGGALGLISQYSSLERV